MIIRYIALSALLLALGLNGALAQQATLTGLVTDSKKVPVAGAHVIVVPDQSRYWTPSEMEPAEKTQTNSKGEFSIDVSSTSPVALVAWGAAHRMTKYAINPATAKSVKIGLALEPGIAVKGKITDRATNAPIAGANIGPLVAGIDTQTQRALRVVPQWTTSDQNGSFSFEGVAPDIAHRFIVQVEGYVIGNVELSEGQATANVPMDKGGFSVGGEVYSKGSRPAAFAGTIVRANGNGFDVVRRAGPAGQFQFDGLPGGTFSVEPLIMDGERSAEVEVVEMPDDNKTSISLEVSAGYYIRGSAIDVETSAPANQVSIGLDDRWTTSSTDGSFVLGPFYQARQLALAVPESDGWRLDELVAANEYNATDGFTDVNGVILRVRRQRLLEIQLDNFGATTQPVSMTVLSDSEEAIRRLATSATLTIPVYRAGSYGVYGISGGLATGVEKVSVTDQTSIPVALKLEQAASASGRVTLVNTDETTRVRGFTLGMDPSGTAASLFSGVSPRPDGTYTFPAMPTGDFILSVTNGSRTRTTTHPVSLSAGSNTLPDIQWEAGNRISGKVLNPQGAPIPFARVTLFQSDGGPLQLETDETGKFQAEDLTANVLPGIVAEAASFANYREQNVQLPADEKILTMQPLGKLVILVEASPSTAWNVHVVRMSPWGIGAYADQLMGHSIFTREVTGGESLETGIGEEGKFRVVAVNATNGAIIVSESFDWAGERATGKTISLSSTATGSISGATGAENQPVVVTLVNTAVPESAGRDKAEFQATSSNGKYSMTGLPAGNYLVMGAGEATSSYALNVELAPGQSVTVDLAAVPMASLSGIVEIAGEPVPGAAVQLLSETDSSYEQRNETTGPNGGFLFEGLTPDSYSISTEFNSENDTIKAAASVAIKAGEEPATIRLDLTPPQPVIFTIDPALNLQSDSPIIMMNRQSRQTTSARWTAEGLEADAAPGQYEVWSGDSVIGNAEVTSEGKGFIRASE